MVLRFGRSCSCGAGPFRTDMDCERDWMRWSVPLVIHFPFLVLTDAAWLVDDAVHFLFVSKRALVGVFLHAPSERTRSVSNTITAVADCVE